MGALQKDIEIAMPHIIKYAHGKFRKNSPKNYYFSFNNGKNSGFLDFYF